MAGRAMLHIEMNVGQGGVFLFEIMICDIDIDML